MKSERLDASDVCSPGVLTPSTLGPLAAGGEGAGRPSLPPAPARPQRPRWRLTPRDRAIVELVYDCGALRDDQIQAALFTPGAASRCQRRLTLLARHGFLDRLPRPWTNAPAIYVLSRRSTAGARLLREAGTASPLRLQTRRHGPLEHLLATNDVRVRVLRDCASLVWGLSLWQTADELAPLLASQRLVPDAYLKIERPVQGQAKTAAFFLELERAEKSRRVLRAKLERYRALYYTGGYSQLFGTRALRLLVVFAVPESSAQRRIALALEDAQQLGVTLARFTHLESLTRLPAGRCLTAPIWHVPGKAEPLPLFEVTTEDAG